MNKGMSVKPFFTEEETRTVSSEVSQDTACLTCGLFKTCLSPKMPHTGKGKRKVLIIAEAPGRTEDEKNIQLIGEAGQLLRRLLGERGLDLDEDFWKTNAIICRPPDNRKPKRAELKLCSHNYKKLIEDLKPNFIWLMGASAIESFYMDKYSDEEGTVLTPTRWRHLCIPDKDVNAWVLPMFHPSYALRYETNDLVMSQYERDLDFAVSCLKKDPPTFVNPEKYVKILKDFEDVCSLLDKLTKNPPEFMAYDYECTGLKPYNKGHKIASVSLCFDKNIAYSFPLEYPHFTLSQIKIIKEKWCKVLENDSYKIAHNLKFEDVWSRVILNVFPNKWHWCTMLAAHILDNRSFFSGLKFQAYIWWGIGNYSKSIAPFLKDRTGSGFNTVMKANLNELLTYGAIDSLLTFWLFMKQRKEVKEEKLQNSVDFFIDGALTFSDMEVNGIPADRSYYEKTDKILEKEIVDEFKNLLSSNEAKLFKKETGREISFTKDNDLRKLFFDILKLKPIKMTERGTQPAVDAETIRNLNVPIAKTLTRLNKLDKIKGTYIGQFLREISDDGKLHSFCNLHTAQTYRSSMERVNFQNIPVRDPDAKKYARSGIFPSPGNLILDFDYGALEVRIICAASKDPVLRARLEDPHTDWAMHIFKLKKEQVTKDIRFYAKNMFVFAMFYGSYYKSCAKSLWDVMKEKNFKTKDGIDMFDHLIKVGVLENKNDFGDHKNKNFERGFVLHLRKVEKEFWKDFAGVRKWQENNQAFYKKNGYIKLATGFKCSGYMTRNDLANYPIQGPAFHCLLWSLIEINEVLKRREMKTRIVGQIHDCCLFDCYPPEKDLVMKISNEIATKKIKEMWEWLDVPLVLEFEETLVDGSWFSKKEWREVA